MAEIGSKGGKTTGKSKARPSETMRKIAKEAWAKKKAKKLADAEGEMPAE